MSTIVKSKHIYLEVKWLISFVFWTMCQISEFLLKTRKIKSKAKQADFSDPISRYLFLFMQKLLSFCYIFQKTKLNFIFQVNLDLRMFFFRICAGKQDKFWESKFFSWLWCIKIFACEVNVAEVNTLNLWLFSWINLCMFKLALTSLLWKQQHYCSDEWDLSVSNTLKLVSASDRKNKWAEDQTNLNHKHQISHQQHIIINQQYRFTICAHLSLFWTTKWICLSLMKYFYILFYCIF